MAHAETDVPMTDYEVKTAHARMHPKDDLWVDDMLDAFPTLKLTTRMAILRNLVFLPSDLLYSVETDGRMWGHNYRSQVLEHLIQRQGTSSPWKGIDQFLRWATSVVQQFILTEGMPGVIDAPSLVYACAWQVCLLLVRCFPNFSNNSDSVIDTSEDPVVQHVTSLNTMHLLQTYLPVTLTHMQLPQHAQWYDHLSHWDRAVWEFKRRLRVAWRNQDEPFVRREQFIRDQERKRARKAQLELLAQREGRQIAEENSNPARDAIEALHQQKEKRANAKTATTDVWEEAQLRAANRILQHESGRFSQEQLRQVLYKRDLILLSREARATRQQANEQEAQSVRLLPPNHAQLVRTQADVEDEEEDNAAMERTRQENMALEQYMRQMRAETSVNQPD